MIDPPRTQGGSPPDAFLAEFARSQERLFAYIFSVVPHRADAEDVFQRASITIWRKFEQWDPRSPFLSWACGVAFNELRNFLRVAGRDRLRFGDRVLELLAEERARDWERREGRVAALGECLRKLDRGERDLIERAYGEEEKIKDLAFRSGWAIQTLYNRLNHIRRKLFQCVELRVARLGGSA